MNHARLFPSLLVHRLRFDMVCTAEHTRAREARSRRAERGGLLAVWAASRTQAARSGICHNDRRRQECAAPTGQAGHCTTSCTRSSSPGVRDPPHTHTHTPSPSDVAKHTRLPLYMYQTHGHGLSDGYRRLQTRLQTHTIHPGTARTWWLEGQSSCPQRSTPRRTVSPSS
jgi:hypothetical protein